MKNIGKLLYWMEEREKIRKKKEAGLPKPWTTDEVFQRTYFCNVHREDDRVTKFIRKMYSPHVAHPLFVHNIILSRFLNWPDTLQDVGYLKDWDVEGVRDVLKDREFGEHKVWGNAYVVTTHGIKMGKIDYLCDRVMPCIDDVMSTLRPRDYETCESVAEFIQGIEGISTFMAGQVVADLKNTPGDELQHAHDWWDFALPGPGSIRGMDWLWGTKVTAKEWHPMLLTVRDAVDESGIVGDLCAQDMQNCLCEFDKYMRVSTGTGRSKRSYNGV